MPLNLYTLRHEKRSLSNPLFKSPLLPQGEVIANDILISKLEKCNIDIIYTSPFLRCINTIKPYALKNNVPIHVDYNLYEWMTHPDFENERVQTLEDKSQFSSVSNDDINIVFPETISSRLTRTKQFMIDLEEKYKDTNLNILICTHMDIMHDIIQYNTRQWPRGYISMGTLIDLQNLDNHITSVLVVYAYFCNNFIPILRYIVHAVHAKKSLKTKIYDWLKQWQSLPSHCTTTKVTALLGYLKEKTHHVLSKTQLFAKEESSQTKLD